MTINIERAVLKTYLTWGNFYLDEKPQLLDANIFSFPFHKRIAEKINEAIKKVYPLSLVDEEIESKVTGNYQQYYIEILSQNSLDKHSLSWYIQVLKRKKIERELNSE